MRKLLTLILHGLQADKEPVLMDHLPVQTEQTIAASTEFYNRDAKLAAARQRHGRAFKCAAVNVDREVMIVPGEIRIVKAGYVPTQAMVAPPKVAPRALQLRAAGGR